MSMQYDKKFIERLKKRDKKAYEQFYKDTSDHFFRYVRGRYYLSQAEVHDLLSDFYVKFWRVIEKYDDSYKFETYVRVVFKNMLKDYFKKSARQTSYESEVDSLGETDPDAVLNKIQGSFQMSRIQKAMEKLDEISYDILFMRYVEGHDYEKIAKKYSTSEQVIRKRLSRALQKIRTLLNV